MIVLDTIGNNTAINSRAFLRDWKVPTIRFLIASLRIVTNAEILTATIVFIFAMKKSVRLANPSDMSS